MRGRPHSDSVANGSANLGICVQVMDGLQHGLRCGVLHRDIKPDNLLISTVSAGVVDVKIADYGIVAPYDARALLCCSSLARERIGLSVVHYRINTRSSTSERTDFELSYLIVWG